jgi:two-component sensor histidine kinase
MLFTTREYDKIDPYISKMEKFRALSSAGLMDIYRLKFRKDTTLGNYRSAISNILRYIQINDSVFNETNTRQRKELEVEYETIKKEDSIQLKNKDILLLTQKNKLQQINLTQDRLYRNIAIAGGCFLAVILTLLYRQYREKQKNNIVIIRKNEQLQHYLDEKEWLLKEIHHRVKNNLQIVMSLLNSQSAYIDNEPARKAIHDSQHRVYAMSLIHQKLYGGENLASVSLPVYIRELGTYLSESFDTGNRIHIVYDIAALEMDVGQAVPLGLILNEAITNAIKYAFPGEMSGTITISLVSLPDHQYLLSVSDNGVGMPPSSIARAGSLGMSLMQGLSVDLDGSFSIEHRNGTTIRITFTHERTIDHLRSLRVVSSN